LFQAQYLTPSPSTAGLSQLSKYREEEGIVPSGALDLSADRCLVGMGAQRVERELSQHGKVVRSMILAVSRGILAEDDVEDPMELVLDGPVLADDVEQPGGAEHAGEQEVSHHDVVGLALDAAHAGNAGDGADGGCDSGDAIPVTLYLTPPIVQEAPATVRSARMRNRAGGGSTVRHDNVFDIARAEDQAHMVRHGHSAAVGIEAAFPVPWHRNSGLPIPSETTP
jgi:hypothetical protein